MENLAIKINAVLASGMTPEGIIKNIKTLVDEDIRQQALKATHGRAKLSSVLTKMYKSVQHGPTSRFYGYVPMGGGVFAITNSHWLVRVQGDPAELLPVGAQVSKYLTPDSINRLFDNVDVSLRDDLTVRYVDVAQHIMAHGRKKITENEYFVVPGTQHAANVFYLEYAFKLTGATELTFKVKDISPWYLQGDGWEMLLCPIRYVKDNASGGGHNVA